MLEDGSVLIRNGIVSKTIDDPKEAAAFLKRVNGMGTGIIKEIVKEYF